MTSKATIILLGAMLVPCLGRELFAQYSSRVIFRESTTISKSEESMFQPIDSSEVVTRRIRKATKDDVLPFVGKGEPHVLTSYPQFGFSAGYSTYSPDFGSLLMVTKAIEDRFRLQGYPVGAAKDRNAKTPNAFMLFSLRARISPRVLLLLETGKRIENDGIEFSGVSISGQVYPLRIGNEQFRPYIGIGIGRYVFSIERSFGYDSRITPVDPSGGYYYLSKISITGGQIKVGIIGSTGFEYMFPTSGRGVGINPFVNYLAVPDATMESIDGEKIVLRLSSFQLGARLIIYL